MDWLLEAPQCIVGALGTLAVLPPLRTSICSHGRTDGRTPPPREEELVRGQGPPPAQGWAPALC